MFNMQAKHALIVHMCDQSAHSHKPCTSIFTQCLPERMRACACGELQRVSNSKTL